MENRPLKLLNIRKKMNNENGIKQQNEIVLVMLPAFQKM